MNGAGTGRIAYGQTPEEREQRRRHVHRVAPPWFPPCDCIHCQPDTDPDTSTDNQQEETP